MQDIQTLISEAAAAMSWIEALAVLLGLAYVILAAAESIWCWPAALLSVSLYIYICLEAQLFAETGLQVFYWIMAIVGWWNWTRHNRKARSAENELRDVQTDSLPISSWPLRKHALVIALNLAGSLLLGWLLASYTQAANPYLDSFTTIFSLYTTWMVTLKVLENWLYWIVIDAASVYLYASRDLYLTALLFILYTVIAAAGYWKWRRHYKTQEQEAQMAEA